MEALDPAVARLVAAKEARRRQLAALPFPEKVRAVVQLQRMVAPVLRRRGLNVRVWDDQSMAAAEPQYSRLERRGLCVTTFAEAEQADRAFWRAKTPIERLRHVEALRELNYGPEVINQGLQRILTVSERPGR